MGNSGQLFAFCCTVSIADFASLIGRLSWPITKTKWEISQHCCWQSVYRRTSDVWGNYGWWKPRNERSFRVPFEAIVQHRTTFCVTFTWFITKTMITTNLAHWITLKKAVRWHRMKWMNSYCISDEATDLRKRPWTPHIWQNMYAQFQYSVSVTKCVTTNYFRQLYCAFAHSLQP